MSEELNSGVVSTKPPSGFRDFVGRAAEHRQSLVEKISSIYRSYGFEQIETPCLENLDVLLGSGGEENEKLIFKTLKRGEKLEEALRKSPVEAHQLADLGLRFDLTVPLCRVFSQYRHQISLPWKVFHIAPVWRAERPQKGRYREFIQCDVDIVGSSSVAAEVEVLHAISSGFHQLGVNDLVLHLNHREFLQGIAVKVGISHKINEFAILLDKKDKQALAKSQQEMELLLGRSLPLEVSDLLEGSFTLDKAEKYAPDAISRLRELIEKLQSSNLKVKEIVFDSSLARGMGYYTGMVFEFKHPSIGYALAGGGRYDKLIGRFSKVDVPAVGGSLGFERLLLYLEENSRIDLESKTIFIPVFDEKLRSLVMDMADQLRKASFRVDVYADSAKLRNQFKYAAAKSYRWVLILGEDELRTKNYKIKDLSSGQEKKISESQLVAELRQLTS